MLSKPNIAVTRLGKNDRNLVKLTIHLKPNLLAAVHVFFLKVKA